MMDSIYNKATFSEGLVQHLFVTKSSTTLFRVPGVQALGRS